MSSHQNYSFNEAMVDYKQENYSVAIEKWLLLLYKSPENDTLIYFLGAAYLAEGQTSEAIVYLDKIEKEQNSVFQKDAAYYRALLHLKNKNPDSAVHSLKNAPSNKNRQLLNEIESAKK